MVEKRRKNSPDAGIRGIFDDLSPEELVILQHIQDGLFVIREGRLAFVNEAFARMAGYEVEDLTGSPIEDIIAPEDQDKVLTRYLRRVAGEDVPERYEFDLLHRNGLNRISVSVSVGLVHHENGTVSSVGTLKDMTEYKETLRRLRRSEREFRDILMNLPDVFYRTDPQGIITMISPYCEQAIGYTPDEMVGRPMTDFYLDPGDRTRVLEALRSSEGRATAVEAAMRHKDGSIIWVSTNASLRTDEDGAVIGVEGIARNITPRKQMEDQLRFLATHDPLTGLANRAEGTQRLDDALARARRSKGRVAVIFLDLDGFKDVNDTQGHETGDRILMAAARRLRSRFRQTDLVARFGGDEFVVVLEGNPTVEDATALAQEIIAALSEPFDSTNGTVEIGASAGISFYPKHGTETEGLLICADKAMYRAKEAGRNRVMICGETG